jgi:hypothetical protein
MKKQLLRTVWASGIIWAMSISIASADLVPCDGRDCTLGSISGLLNNIVQWLLPIAWLLGAIGIALAGFYLLTSAGNQGKIEKGKKMLWGVFWALLLAHMAYLIVQSIISLLNGGTIS